jgi:large subunit ribosomal protein L31e
MPEDIEHIFTIPLRKKWEGPRTKRANHAINVIRRYVVRHVKDPERKGKRISEDKVWIDPKINEFVWARGREKPPRKIKVKAVYIHEEKIIGVEFPEEEKPKEKKAKKEEKEGKEEKIEAKEKKEKKAAERSKEE